MLPNSTLKYLNLSYNKIKKTDYENFSNFLQFIPSLEELTLLSMNLDFNFFDLLFKSIPNLIYLNLSNNDLGDKGIHFF